MGERGPILPMFQYSKLASLLELAFGIARCSFPTALPLKQDNTPLTQEILTGIVRSSTAPITSKEAARFFNPLLIAF